METNGYRDPEDDKKQAAYTNFLVNASLGFFCVILEIIILYISYKIIQKLKCSNHTVLATLVFMNMYIITKLTYFVINGE